MSVPQMEGTIQLETSGQDDRAPPATPGRIIWKVSWLMGSAIIAISISLSYFFSLGSYSDAPNHDLLFSIPIIVGLLLMGIGAVLYSVWSGPRAMVRVPGIHRSTVVLALAVMTVVVSVYVANPLISPVAFLRDSDLDGVQDYCDDYPHNHSRIDYPWVSFGIRIGLSYTQDECNVTIGYGAESFWLDAVAIEVLNKDNATGLARTLLADLDDKTVTESVQYFNTPRFDRLDMGDHFLIGRHTFGGGTLVFWAFSEYGWQPIQAVRLP